MQFNSTLTHAVCHDLKTNSIPMLLGEPGIGKSSWVEDLATNMHTKAFTLACNQLADKSDLTGARLVPVTDNGHKTYVQTFYPHVVISQAISYAKDHPDETPILFLDELNRTTPDVTSEALSIPTMRAIGNQKLPDNLKVITAGNDKGNVTSLDSASISRFVLYHVTPDLDTFIKVNDNLHPAILNVLNQHPDYLFQKPIAEIATAAKSDDDDDDDDEDDSQYAATLSDIFDSDDQLKQITTPRTITSLSKWLNSYDDKTLKNFLADSYQDTNGETTTFLEDSIKSHTGNTVFSSAVYDQLVTMLSQAAPQASSMTPRKPQGYNDLLTAQTNKDLSQKLDTATPKSLQSYLVYALYDDQNQAPLIKNLIDNLTSRVDHLDNDHITKITKLALANSLNDDTVNYFQTLDSPVVSQLQVILSMN